MDRIQEYEQKSISVFVPSFNHAPFVERCLRSIFAQTRAPAELLVIDDGSSDDSPNIIESALKDCPFHCELIVRPNRGLSATLNEGLDKTSGEFFAYLGSDDVWLPRLLEKRAAMLEADPNAVLACGHAYLIDDADRIIDRTRDWVEFTGGTMLDFLLRGQIFASSSVVYRRSALAKHRWNEDSILEDYELYLKLSADGPFAFDREELSAWRQHGTNVSGDFPRMMTEWIAAQDREIERLGMERSELDRIQRELRFDAVASFVRNRRRAAGLKLFVSNLGGARSPFHIARTAFRFIVPPPLFEWNRRRKRERAIKRFGRLKFAGDTEGAEKRSA